MNKEKKKITGRYILLVLAGILLGWVLFGRSDAEEDHRSHDHETAEEAADSEYTCSMHPQVRQDEPGDCPICGMELIPASEEDDHQEDDPFVFAMRESHYHWANVQTAPVSPETISIESQMTGMVAVNEKETRNITANFPGRVDKLFADYTGLFIREGEPLATLYSPEMMQAQQELLNAARDKEQNPRLYSAARERLRLFNLTGAQIDNIESAGEARSHIDVYAGKSGYLTQRLVSEGDYVSTGDNLFSIADLNTVWVELDAYESHLGSIRKGDEAVLDIPSHPGRELSGKVEFVDPFIDRQTRTARVRLTVQNDETLLKPGMLVNANVKSGELHQQLMVPSTAILWTGKQAVVYVKKTDRDGFTFEYREIEIGAPAANKYPVLSGLSAGEEIAVNGVFAIDAAAQLRGHFSMMSPPETIELPEPFRSNLELLFEQYFDIKNALADDDPEQMSVGYAESMQNQLEETGEHSLEGEHHMFWMEKYGLIAESMEEFLAADDLEARRARFEPLSEAMISVAQTLGAIGQTFYVAFCPMYDDDRGAYWLSEFEEIKNPYFGSMMLSCGEVREELREGIGGAEMPEEEMEGHVH